MLSDDPVRREPPIGEPGITPDVADELVRIAQLHAQGVLSDEEFEARRTQVLDSPPER
ncbi:MAG TPA: SHOCT domain-containing protein [Amnibacterium sp.]|nr:SHOCT domain-containing protein [Amnibacterium sp.]